MRRSLSAATISSVARHVFAALRFALDIGPIGEEGAAAPVFGDVEGFLGAREHFGHGAGMARRRDAADGDRHRDRPGAGRHQFITDTGDQPLGGDGHVVGRTIRQHDAELVARVAAERVLAAHAAVDALGDRGDHLVGDIVAVGQIDPSQIVDAHQQKSARGAETQSVFDRLFQRRDEVVPVELAGEFIMAGEISELAFAFVAVVDDAHGAERARRLAVGTGEPASDVLDPQQRFRASRRAQTIYDAVEHAVAVVAAVRAHDRIDARLRAIGLEQLRVGAAGCDGVAVADQKDVGRVGTPAQFIAGEVPAVESFADGGENLGAIWLARRRVGLRAVVAHGRPAPMAFKSTDRDSRRRFAPKYLTTLKKSEI